MRVKVKICGMMAPGDVEAARGADALGVVVEVPRSRRNVGLGRAAGLLALVPRGVLRVAVTTSPEPAVIRRILALKPDVLQLHLELPPARWRKVRALVGREIALWGLLGLGEGDPARALERAAALRGAPLDGVVLDTVAGGRTGGTGVTHDWRLSRAAREILAPLPVILAGGLTPDNVAAAIRAVEPDWVDVSSGVEEGGRKSPALIARFLEAVCHAVE
ncbi:phosphoribosylanthranilate isomerase [Candidatus Bipolaricaulota sp. J31]